MLEVTAPLEAWESFYVIVGSSAAALSGLTFVVIALIADAGPRSSDELGIATFITPTIYHFCIALLVSAILSAPWHALIGVSVALGVSAIAGLGYVLVVILRARRVKSYKFVMEDWVWHTMLPVLAYVAIAAAAVILSAHAVLALFITGAATLGLLYVGIHNAWDTVTYVTIARFERERDRKD